MSNRPRSSRTPERRPPTGRQVALQRRESNLQRRVILALAGVILLVLLLIIGGLVWEQVIQPRQTIKQVNQATLTRNTYDQLARDSVIQQMVQGLQFARLFGPGQGFGSGTSFDEQVLQTNLQLAEIGTPRGRRQPPNDAIIEQWVDRQLLEQGAKEQFRIDPQPGEVDQHLVAELGSLLQMPEVAPDTETTSEPEDSAATETAETPTPEAPTTPTATALPTPTPQPDEATQQADQIIDILYNEYTNILNAVPAEAPAVQRTPHVSKDELSAALHRIYREQLIRTRVQEALVPELPKETGEPTHIRARHILLQVPEPSPSPAPADDAETPEQSPEATEEAAPEPTPAPTPEPTPTPEELEKLFEERKAEADALYQQLIENPESFEEVARERSEDPVSAQRGGDVGTFDRQGNVEDQPGQTLVQEFVDAAWALEEGEISKPVRTQFGWHIIQRVPEDPEAQLQRLRQEALDEWLAKQRQNATIEPPPSPTPALESPAPLSEEVTPFATEEPAESPEPEAPSTP